MKKNIFSKFLFAAVIVFVFFAFGKVVFAQQGLSVQTNAPTNVQDTQTTLNGTLSNLSSYSTSVGFQWGTTTSYGNTTTPQTLTSSGPFSQIITGLTPNTTYHYRAVAQDNQQTANSQDMTFTTTNTGTGGTNQNPTSGGPLTVGMEAINLTTNNLNWSPSVNAKAGDLLSFAITLQAGNQEVHNVVVKDILPAGLTYKGNLTVNATLNPPGDPSTGVSVGTVPANGISIVAFQAQVNDGQPGQTITNSATVTSNEGGTQTASGTVNLTAAGAPGPSGPTSIETGLTNNLLTDSFFPPLTILLSALWLYYSGTLYSFADWLKEKIK
jgi:uncharacterized repeat protein (TIGR01451 family)